MAQQPPPSSAFGMAIIFAIGAVILFGPVATTPMESHTLKINSNPISQSEIPENATVVQYDTLTGESRNIANNAIDQDSLFDQTYNYEQSRSNKPAEQFTSADYLQFDNTYYPIFASTNTYNKPDLNDIMENTIAKFLGMFAVLSTIAGIGGSLRQY